MTNFIDQKLQELEKLKVYHNGEFRELRYDLGHDRFSTIKDFLKSSLQSMQEETRREMIKEITKRYLEIPCQLLEKKGDPFTKILVIKNKDVLDLLASLSSPKQEKCSHNPEQEQDGTPCEDCISNPFTPKAEKTESMKEEK